MNEERLLKVLLAPIVSEKSMRVADKNRQFVFKVAMDANKLEIKAAAERLFKVAVKSVRVAVVKGKSRVFRQETGRRSDWKKAYVTLQEGHDIDFSQFEVKG
jgi:large subunit ribosomal protein L23